MNRNEKRYRAKMLRDAGKVLLFKGFHLQNSTQAMKELGEMVVGDIKARISDQDFQPLHPTTVRIKGHRQPLVDTGELRDAIKAKVRRGIPK